MKRVPGPIARFVRGLVGDKGMTHEDLADYLGIDKSAISQWTTGRAMPSDENLIKLAKLADVDAADLIHLKQAISRANRGVEVPSKSGEMLSPKEREIINQLRQGKLQEIIAELVEMLTRKNASIH